jgi:RNA polymerase sigma-70 factor (ECF subfamily)
MTRPPDVTLPHALEPRTDAELIAAWVKGDEAAAAELVHRHASAVARFLGAAGGRDDVEDLVQETFFRAFRKIETFRGTASFRTWLFAIGANALKDLRRRGRRRQVIPLADADREVADPRADPLGDVVERGLLERLREAVPKLPPMQRNVFLLRAQQGLEYDEIAAALGTSSGAARVHYHQAVKRLKAALGGVQEGNADGA